MAIFIDKKPIFCYNIWFENALSLGGLVRNITPKTTPVNIEKLAQLTGHWCHVRIRLLLVCYHGDGHEDGRGWVLETFEIGESPPNSEERNDEYYSISYSRRTVSIDSLRSWLSKFDDQHVKVLLDLERGKWETRRPIARAFIEIDDELEKLAAIPINQ